MATIKGEWIFNDRIGISEEIFEEVGFKCNGVIYTKMITNVPTKQLDYTDHGGSVIRCYVNDAWTDAAYKTVDFGSTEKTVSGEFVDWIFANARCISINDDPPELPPDVDGIPVKGTWEFKRSMPADVELEQNINFISDGVSYSSIHCSVVKAGGYSITCIEYDDDHVASGMESVEWERSELKEVRFGNNVQYVSKEFHDWLTANAIEITRKVSGMWEFDSEIDVPSGFGHENVTFISNGRTFASMSTSIGQYGETVLVYADSGYDYIIYAYSGDGWHSANHRTVDFGTSEQEVSEEFYVWLDKYANRIKRVLSGKRVFDSDLPLTEFEEIIDFKSMDYTLVKMYSDGRDMKYVLDGGTEEIYVYDGSANKWQDTKLKTIDFGKTEQNVSEKFYQWIMSNTSVAPEDTGIDPVDPDIENLIIPLSSPVGMKLLTKGKLCDKNIVIKVSFDPSDNLEVYDGQYEDLPDLITFSVNVHERKEYLAMRGVTWTEWQFSDYNTGGIYINHENVVCDDCGQNLFYNGAPVLYDDVIIDGAEYTANGG